MCYAGKKPASDRLSKLNEKVGKDTSDFSEMLGLAASISKEKPEEALCWLEQVKKASEKIRFVGGITGYCRNLSTIARNRGLHREAADSIGILLTRNEKYLPAPAREDIRWTLANVLYEGAFNDEAWALAEDALLRPENKAQEARWYWLRGALNTNYMKLDEATADFLRSLAYFRQHKPDDEQVILNLLGLANIQSELKNSARAIHYNEQALNAAIRTSDQHREHMAYGNLAICYKNLDSTSLSLTYFEKSLGLARQMGDSIQVAQNLMNIANLYVKLGKNTEALESFEASLDLCRAHHIQYGVMLNHINVGGLYQALKKYSKARASLDSAMSYALVLNMPEIEARVHEYYSYLYEETGSFDLALEHSRKYHKLRNQLLGDETQEKIAELEIRYETMRKDHEIALIQEKLMKKRVQNRILVLAFILIGSAAFIAIYFTYDRNKALLELYNRNIELLNRRPVSVKQQPSEEDSKGKETLRAVFDKLLTLMEKEELYKNSSLSINDVAGKLMTNEKYVSSAISTYSRMNYSHFINFYRINEAKRLITKSPQTKSLSEVMYECGFNSRTTFYNAFQKFTGMSPKKFKSIAQSTASPVEGSGEGI